MYRGKLIFNKIIDLICVARSKEWAFMFSNIMKIYQKYKLLNQNQNVMTIILSRYVQIRNKKSKIYKPNNLVIIHREKKSSDKIDHCLEILFTKNYGRSKIIFGVLR